MAEAFSEPVRAVEPIRADRIDVGKTLGAAEITSCPRKKACV
jgi:hypothetical protein